MYCFVYIQVDKCPWCVCDSDIPPFLGIYCTWIIMVSSETVSEHTSSLVVYSCSDLPACLGLTDLGHRLLHWVVMVRGSPVTSWSISVGLRERVPFVLCSVNCHIVHVPGHRIQILSCSVCCDLFMIMYAFHVRESVHPEYYIIHYFCNHHVQVWIKRQLVCCCPHSFL